MDASNRHFKCRPTSSVATSVSGLPVYDTAQACPAPLNVAGPCQGEATSRIAALAGAVWLKSWPRLILSSRLSQFVAEETASHVAVHLACRADSLDSSHGTRLLIDHSVLEGTAGATEGRGLGTITVPSHLKSTNGTTMYLGTDTFAIALLPCNTPCWDFAHLSHTPDFGLRLCCC
ncbi:hypothetical protein NDU88_008102 [Pleurodeles waltl]|uniref:Uncharacterized protein n=1 Tax=Pleurodeles waltl TaxID=8319 RepID=A0AAV7NY66_PLEWA|nr:hypothetical protein NDU88_008102 [Pleurodeles waltl]